MRKVAAVYWSVKAIMALKNKWAVSAFILALLASSVATLPLVNVVKANGVPITYLPVITINSDGSITPQTGLISRQGDTYSLNSDIYGYGIEIECSNIIFDGKGHIVNTTSGDTLGLSLHIVNGVTARNLEVYGRYTNIYLYCSSNCLLANVKTNNRIYLTDGSNFNTITNSTFGRVTIGLGNSNNNLVIKNNIETLWVAGSHNRFSQNNFFLTDLAEIIGTNFWDNGSVGNYWGNYSIQYPNATEIGSTGIGDMPYIIERTAYTTKEWPYANNVDNYPLMYPYDIKKDTIAHPTPEPHIPGFEPETESFTTPLIVAVSFCALLTAGVATGLIYYHRKRSR